ncbi:Uncharacterised protein [Mycobacterium tuberculosis]|uniref:Uncharacterized protein n=1 Tax=Mycobacterium tuberculosis TaxID=1773 RepID=A0A0U0QP76_MYCTX|nr:Uncharacterised protein [Mycobacterium tuberculosis]
MCGEQLAEPGHERAAHRGRRASPCRKCCGRRGDRVVGLLRGGRCDAEQHVAGDRCARGQAVFARLAKGGGYADRLAGFEHLGS